jgi:hypothetical protein
MTKEFWTNLLSSRTVWTIVVLFLINGVAGIREFIPANLLPLIDAILGVAAIYFRVNPKIGFKK